MLQDKMAQIAPNLLYKGISTRMSIELFHVTVALLFYRLPVLEH